MTRAAKDAAEVRTLAGNIIALYLEADGATREAGRYWYAEEAARCRDFGQRWQRSPDAVAGAAAAISPGMRWDAVFSHLAALLKSPFHKVPTYNREFVARAVAILHGAPVAEVLRGPKVTAFYRLLSGRDMAAVVVDGHAWNIARGALAVFRRRPGYVPPSAARITPRRYRLAVAAYREAAEVLGEAAHAVQAATWLFWRAQWDEARREAAA